jgi:sugar lactone lactonase YvrE
MIDLENNYIKPLALSCLAYPSGLVLSNDERILYVCETCKNRILRFVLTDQGIFYFSVYYQFSGRFGPTAVAVSQSDLLYVARYEFQQVSEEGVISVINHKGNVINNITIPGCPEISGMTFSR